MKPRRLVFFVIAILVVTALSAAGAAAQDAIQQSASPSLAVPNDTGTFDTGTKQSSEFIAGETNTNSAQQKLGPKQRKQPRERAVPNNEGEATPTESAPSGGNSVDPGSGGSGNPGHSSGDTSPKELPRSSGPSLLLPVGVLLLGSGIMASTLLRRR